MTSKPGIEEPRDGADGSCDGGEERSAQRTLREEAPETVATRLAVCSLVIERIRCAVPECGGHGEFLTVISREHEPMLAAMCGAIEPYRGRIRITFEEHPMVLRNRIVKARWERRNPARASA